MSYVRLSPCCIALPVCKSKKRKLLLRMRVKVDSEEVESKWLKGVSSHKRTRVHNNFRSEHSLLYQKVHTLEP